MSKDLNALAEKIKENIDWYSPVVVTGNIASGKTTFLTIFNRVVCPFVWPHGGVDEQGNLYPSMAKHFAKMIDAETLFQKMLDAISSGKCNTWKDVFAPYGYIVIDDFDRFKERFATQQMLFSYFSECNKPVIVASKDKIEGNGYIDELVDYFLSGAHIHLEDPTKEEKFEHFDSFRRLHKLEIEEEALSWLKTQEFRSFTAALGYFKTLKSASDHLPLTYETCVVNAKDFIINKGKQCTVD